MQPARTVAIDFRAYDHMSVASGQYRYGVDLAAGLAKLQPEIDFVILGSRPDPVSEMVPIFADPHWRYVSVPRLTGKGRVYREHSMYFRLLRKLKINLLHTLHTFVPMYPPVPVIETVHDMMFELFPDYAGIVRAHEYRMHKWAFLRFVNRAIAISETTKDDLQNLWHYPAEKIDVVYHGTAFGNEFEPPSIGNEPVVLSHYNLEPRKNLPSLLEAVAASKLPFKLVLFGHAATDLRRDQQFREEIARCKLQDRLVLTGFLTDAQLNGWYHRANVFIFPSLYEGFGLPVLEAMRAGACVLAHNGSAMAEVVGDSGLKIDMNSVREIRAALERCLQDSDLRRDLGSRAAERAELFTRERMARETLVVYRKVLNL